MFNELKTTAIAMYFLKSHDGVMSYLKLIKLLYLSDRRCIERYNYRMTFDTYYNMKNGVVLSNVLSRIYEETKDPNDDISFWHNNIIRENYDVKLRSTDLELISIIPNEEMQILVVLIDEFKSFTKWEMVDYIHLLPEWEDPKHKGVVSLHLSLDTILNCLEKTEKEKEEFFQTEKNLSMPLPF